VSVERGSTVFSFCSLLHLPLETIKAAPIFLDAENFEGLLDEEQTPKEQTQPSHAKNT